MVTAVPLLGWKRSAITATISLCLQGVCSQVGYFIHMQNHVFKRPIAFPRSQTFAIAFLGLLHIVIAQLKDIPDTEGDRKHGVKNLSILIGSKPVFWICVSLLEIAYGVAIMVGISAPYLWSKIITWPSHGASGVGHAILALILWYRAKSVDLKSNASTHSFYMLIWKLVSAEYFLIPFVR
ncbi:hypothetical protein VNO77_33884 [Canavalia gladiata]|uniref:Uncharacterized protein n=1 Tax=Canavalia gladiata TaxID=3824 RepID=A0AAN9KFJ3_CANGL